MFSDMPRPNGGGGSYPSTETILWQSYESTQNDRIIELPYPITDYKLIKFVYVPSWNEAEIELVIESDTLLATATPNADSAIPRIGIGYERSSLAYMRLINLVPNTSNKNLHITLARIFTTANSYNSVCLLQKIIGIN